jgi:hypothetical protein
MDTLLMAIGGYSIGGYSIGGYFSNGYWWCEELLHTFTTKICTHNKNPVGSGTTM